MQRTGSTSPESAQARFGNASAAAVGAVVDQGEEKIDASGSMLTPDAMDKTINPIKTIVLHTMNFRSDAIG